MLHCTGQPIQNEAFCRGQQVCVRGTVGNHQENEEFEKSAKGGFQAGRVI